MRFCSLPWSSLLEVLPFADRSEEEADQLFAPFSKEDFPTQLDTHRLRAMLQRQLHTVPVASQADYELFHSWFPGLGELGPDAPAPKLASRLGSALLEDWPRPASNTEMNCTHFWDELGFRFPEWPLPNNIDFQQEATR